MGKVPLPQNASTKRKNKAQVQNATTKLKHKTQAQNSSTKRKRQTLPLMGATRPASGIKAKVHTPNKGSQPAVISLP